MQRITINKYTVNRSTILSLALLAVWFAGLSLGFSAARSYGDTLVSCMSQAVQLPASMAVSFVVLFPLLVSALAVMTLGPYSLYVICFLRAFLLAIMLQTVGLTFQSGACLAAIFLMFSSLVFSPVLLWFWWRRLSLRMVCLKPDTVTCVVIGLLIGLMDHFFVSPFLMDIVHF